MDYVLNYGQGFFIFGLFALDSRIVVLPVLNRIRRTLKNFVCDRRRRHTMGGESGEQSVPVVPDLSDVGDVPQPSGSK